MTFCDDLLARQYPSHAAVISRPAPNLDYPAFGNLVFSHHKYERLVLIHLNRG